MNKTDLELLKVVAKSLGNLLQEVVFIGGVTTSFYIQDESASRTTPTEDVDIIIDVLTLLDYEKFSKNLRSMGFKQRIDQKGPICRFFLNEIALDVIPVEAQVLGFSNKWYREAFDQAITVRLDQFQVKILSLQHFLITKAEAFRGRAQLGDALYNSKDFEDIVVVLNGRENLEQDLLALKGNPDISKSFKDFLMSLMQNEAAFNEAVTACLYDYGSGVANMKAANLMATLKEWTKE